MINIIYYDIIITLYGGKNMRILKKLLLFIILPVLALTSCSALFNNEPKPNSEYDNTKYFNKFGIGLPNDLKPSYFCYSTWTSTFSFGGDNYAVYTLDKRLDLDFKEEKNLELEEEFSENLNRLLNDYEEKAGFGDKKLPDFSREYIWYKKDGSNKITLFYFEELNELYIFSIATHAVS